MGISRHFFKQHNFIVTKFWGKIDNDDLMGHVIEFNKESKGLSNLKELADCREITDLELLSVENITKIAGGEKYKDDSILAILIPEESELLYGMARVYQTFAATHRKSVEIFRDLKQALDWLTDNKEESDALTALVRTI